MSDEITWTCDVCGEPVLDGDGYVHVSETDRATYRRDAAVWKARRPAPTGGPLDGLLDGGDLSAMPEWVRWLVHHAACNPRPNDVDTWIPVEQVRTPAGLLSWTLHLMGQCNTAEETDWISFVYRALHRNGINTRR